MDYAVVGLIGIFSAITWRVTFVLTRSIQRNLDEFKASTKEGFANQEKRLDKHEVLLLGLSREVSFLTGALMGVPAHPRASEKVGSRD